MTTTHAVPSSSDTHRQPLPCAEASEPCVRNGSLPALDQALDCLYAHTTERDVRSALSNAEVAHNTRVIRSILEPPSTASDRAVDSLRICFTHGGDGDRRTTEWSPTRTGSAFGGDRDTWTWFQMDRWSADELAQTVSALGLLYNVTVTPSSVACPRRDAIGWRCSWMARVVDDMCARFVASLSAGAPGTDKRSCDAGSPYDMAKLAGHLLALLDDRLSRQLSCLADNASDVINGVPYRAHLIERARVAIEHGHVAQALSGPSAIDYEHMRGTRYLLCALAAFGQVSLSSVDTMGTGDGGGTTVRDTMEVDDDARPHCSRVLPAAGSDERDEYGLLDAALDWLERVTADAGEGTLAPSDILDAVECLHNYDCIVDFVRSRQRHCHYPSDAALHVAVLVPLERGHIIDVLLVPAQEDTWRSVTGTHALPDVALAAAAVSVRALTMVAHVEPRDPVDSLDHMLAAGGERSHAVGWDAFWVAAIVRQLCGAFRGSRTHDRLDLVALLVGELTIRCRTRRAPCPYPFAATCIANGTDVVPRLVPLHGARDGNDGSAGTRTHGRERDWESAMGLVGVRPRDLLHELGQLAYLGTAVGDSDWRVCVERIRCETTERVLGLLNAWLAF